MYAYCELCLKLGTKTNVHESQFVKLGDNFKALCPKHLKENYKVESMEHSINILKSI